ncbi:MAG: hypothetical protein ACOCYU_00885 [Brevefilum sp.]
MAEKEILPFKSINVLVERDYLEKVLERILRGIQHLPKEDQKTFNNRFRKFVSVLGFRNPLRAPLPLQVKAYASAFEEKDEVVPFTLSNWTRLENEFAKQVEDWLESEGWENLSLERSFEESDGFFNEWPDDLNPDELIEKFQKDNPDVEVEQQDILLMILWVSGQLPPENSEL